MKYWLSIFCLLFSCTKSIVKDVSFIPKPQKLELSDSFFLLNYNTNLIANSLFFYESEYLKKLLNCELKGSGNTIELLKKEGLQEEEFLLNISEYNLTIEASGQVPKSNC